jgi:general secretion pathway protein G
LLEILVVVLIITILGTIVGVSVANKPGEARVAAARAQMATLETALDMYRMHNGSYPTMRQGLLALWEKPGEPPVPSKYPEEGYLKKKSQLQDPWGNEWVYLVPGRGRVGYEIVSYGADGEPGGEGEHADLSTVEE